MKNSKATQIGPLKCGSNLIPTSSRLNALARKTGLFLRSPRKIGADLLLYALVSASCFGEGSCRAIALALGVTADVKISRIAVWKHLAKPAIIPFLEKIIAHAIEHSLKNNNALLEQQSGSNIVLKGIKRILIRDASTFSLHACLAHLFPGASNQHCVSTAQLKLQYVMDLLTGQVVDFSLDSYQRNDAKAAMDFISKLLTGDLIMADLGYYSARYFQAIIAAGAFFISRFKFGPHVFDRDENNENRIDLNSRLKCLAPLAGMSVRIPVLLKGRSGLAKCDLIAIRVPDAVANERRRKIREKARKQKRNAPSKKYLARQDWTVLTTNLAEETASIKKVQELYLMRWRVEMIFKAFKSHSAMPKLATHKTNANHAKALILTWILLMVLLGNRGAFAMAKLREIRPPLEQEAYYELQIENLSLFKTLQKLIWTMGFYMELCGCGMNLGEHFERVLCYGRIHNQTELNPNRTALSEILGSVLEVTTIDVL